MRKPIFIAISIIFFICSALFGEDRALIVGINQYNDPRINHLYGCVNDAKRMRNFAETVLGFQQDKIKMLTNQDATGKNIMDAFENWLIRKTEPGDRVLFFFSGHGYYQPDKNNDEQDGMDETIVPYDTVIDKNLKARNMISDDEIGALLKKLCGRKVVVMIDSCHSGTISRGMDKKNSSPPVKTIELTHAARFPEIRFRSVRRNEESFVKGDKERIVWTAVSASQKAFDNIDIRPVSGVFTNAFLNGIQHKMADANKNGVITYSELLDYVRKKSEDFCARHKEICVFGLTPALEAAPGLLARPVFSSFGLVQHYSGSPGPAHHVTDIMAHDNPYGVSIEILPGTRVPIGQEIRFRIKSRSDGYLIVLDMDAQKKIKQIFPNKYSDRAGKGNRISAGKPVVIPNSYYGFRLVASEPAGRGALIAIVVKDPIPLNDILNTQKDLDVIENQTEYLTSVAGRLRRIWTNDSHNRRLRWSLAEQEYEIIK